MLKKGLVWRVGDGSSIRIWEDDWLPRDELRRLFTPRGASLLSRVEELIDPTTGTWDEVLVRETFWEVDADCILCLLVHEGMNDLVACHYNKNGQFSVRSAYKVHVADSKRNSERRGEGSSSSVTSRGHDYLWKQLWKLNCPKKMVHFLWRMGQ